MLARARSTAPSVAAMRRALGKVSLLDWPALTWSLGCTSRPLDRWARRATTSLTFMLVDVPEPVWKTSTGNSPSCLPDATSRAAAAMLSARGASMTPSWAFTCAAAALRSASACTTSGGTGWPLIGKFSTALAVCAPQSAAAGTSTSPMESCSMRTSGVVSLMTPSCALGGVPAGRDRGNPRRRHTTSPPVPSREGPPAGIPVTSTGLRMSSHETTPPRASSPAHSHMADA